MRADDGHASTDHNDVELQPAKLAGLSRQLVGLETLILRLGIEVINRCLAEVHSNDGLHALAERLGHVS